MLIEQKEYCVVTYPDFYDYQNGQVIIKSPSIRFYHAMILDRMNAIKIHNLEQAAITPAICINPSVSENEASLYLIYLESKGIPIDKNKFLFPKKRIFETFDEAILFLSNNIRIISYPDGSFYDGEVSRNGQPKGCGIIKNQDGSIYREGFWDGDFDYKTVWIMGYLPWYEDGELFWIQGEPIDQNPIYPFFPLYPGQNFLYPGICLTVPNRGGVTGNSSNQIFPAVDVMFPHLQDLGLSNDKNRFSRMGFTNAEACVKFEGFNSLQHYYDVFEALENTQVLRAKTKEFVKDVNSVFKFAEKIKSVINFITN